MAVEKEGSPLVADESARIPAHHSACEVSYERHFKCHKWVSPVATDADIAYDGFSLLHGEHLLASVCCGAWFGSTYPVPQGGRCSAIHFGCSCDGPWTDIHLLNNPSWHL